MRNYCVVYAVLQSRAGRVWNGSTVVEKTKRLKFYGNRNIFSVQSLSYRNDYEMVSGMSCFPIPCYASDIYVTYLDGFKNDVYEGNAFGST
jgi:hypothetical protein